jgi:hypothetical protein
MVRALGRAGAVRRQKFSRFTSFLDLLQPVTRGRWDQVSPLAIAGFELFPDARGEGEGETLA